MQGRSQTAWKQNPNITIMFHESIAILLKNAPFFEVPFRNLDDTLRKDAGCISELNYIEQEI